MIRLESSLPAVAVGAVARIRVDWFHRVALAILNMSVLEQAVVWQVLSWMIPGDDEGRENDWNELEANKIVLVVSELAVDALASLRKTENGTDCDQYRGDEEANEEAALASEGGAELVVANESDGEGGEEDQKNEEGTGLECETAQEDGVGFVGLLIVLVGLGNTNQCRTENLENSRNNISADEDPEDKLWAKPLAACKSQAAGPVDKAGQANVDGGGDEDWCGDDEEVLNDEVDDIVWVLLCGEGAEGIADDFHQAGKREWDEVPGAELDYSEGVDAEGDEEEDDPSDAKSKGWGVAVGKLAIVRTVVIAKL